MKCIIYFKCGKNAHMAKDCNVTLNMKPTVKTVKVKKLTTIGKVFTMS